MPRKPPKMNWAERNVVHPMARGFDLAVNDWFGENGLARPLTEEVGLPAWQTSIAPQEDNAWASFAEEIPRAIIAAGPLAPYTMSTSVPGMIAAGALAGYARDPGGDNKEWVRPTNAAGGAIAAGVAGTLGPVLGRGAWQMYHKVAHPAAHAALRRFIGSTEEAGQMLVKDPAATGAAAETLPRYSGTTYRQNPADAFNQRLQDLQAGDVFNPGRPMSSSVDKGTASGFANNTGAFITIRNKSGRDARYMSNWEGEILSNPNAQYKVVSVTRDPKTGTVTHVELEEIGPEMGMFDRAVQGVLETGRPSSAAAAKATIASPLQSATERQRYRELGYGKYHSRQKNASPARQKLISAAIRSASAKSKARPQP